MDKMSDTIREALYKEAFERAAGWSAWSPNDAFRTGFETGVDRTFAALSLLPPAPERRSPCAWCAKSSYHEPKSNIMRESCFSCVSDGKWKSFIFAPNPLQPLPTAATEGAREERDDLDIYEEVYSLLADMKPRFEDVERVQGELFKRFSIHRLAVHPAPAPSDAYHKDDGLPGVDTPALSEEDAYPVQDGEYSITTDKATQTIAALRAQLAEAKRRKDAAEAQLLGTGNVLYLDRMRELTARAEAAETKLADVTEQLRLANIDANNTAMELAASEERVKGLTEALEYAVKQVPELGTVPGIATALAHGKPQDGEVEG